MLRLLHFSFNGDIHCCFFFITNIKVFLFSTSERHWETKPLMKMDDFDVCNKKKTTMNITIKGKMQQS
jgi:hypothetical protein